MHPADGTYRLTTDAGTKPMDVVVSGGSASFLLDSLVWNEAAGMFVAAHLNLTIECLGTSPGTFRAFVGVAPGTEVDGKCVKIA